MNETETIKRLKDFIKKAIPQGDVILEHPADRQFGDFSTNVAMQQAKIEKKNPREVAEAMATSLRRAQGEFIETIQVAGPGFINFFLKKDYLLKEAELINQEQAFADRLAAYQKGKKYLLEHTSPEPTKTLHIGHFRNNFLGMSMSYILKTLGAEVTIDCVNNDRGMKICKTMWGYLYFGHKKETGEIEDYIKKITDYKLGDEELLLLTKDSNWREKIGYWFEHQDEWYEPADFGLSSDKFDNVLYSPASRSAELMESVNLQVQAMLKAWEEEDEQVRLIWRKIIDWSIEGYNKTYKRIDSHHDKVWNESDFYKGGKAWVVKGLDTGVFKKLPDGAVLTNLEKYGLSDTIVIKGNGTSMYLTQDLQLTSLKVTNFPSDHYIWVVGK